MSTGKINSLFGSTKSDFTEISSEGKAKNVEGSDFNLASTATITSWIEAFFKTGTVKIFENFETMATILAITSEYLITGEAGLKGDVTLAFAHFNNSGISNLIQIQI